LPSLTARRSCDGGRTQSRGDALEVNGHRYLGGVCSHIVALHYSEHMNNVTSSREALQAFQAVYRSKLDERVRRSEVIGAIHLAKSSAAVFFDSTTGKFTLVEKCKSSGETAIYDCVPREQWGRNVMLFGHVTQSGGYIPSGHATLDDNLLIVKLASGSFYSIEVNPNAACLLQFVFTAPALSVPKRSIARRGPFGIKGGKGWRDTARPKHRGVTESDRAGCRGEFYRRGLDATAWRNSRYIQDQ
jgi:hypothetical protein